MAEQIISPGVFTRENDLSFLPQGIGQIGAAIIGPTTKGPAFVPTVISNFSDFERRFGGLNSETYIPQTVREYLRNAGSVTVCRVLAGGGYTYTAGALSTSFIALGVSGSGSSENVLLGAIFPSKNTSDPGLGSTTLDGFAGKQPAGDNATNFSDNFNLILTGSNTNKQYSASLTPTNSNYLFKQLGDSPFNSKQGSNTYVGNGFTYVNFKSVQTSLAAVEASAEVATVTFAAGAHATSSVVNNSLQASGALFLANELSEDYGFTLVFESSSGVAERDNTSGSVFEISIGGTTA